MLKVSLFTLKIDNHKNNWDSYSSQYVQKRQSKIKNCHFNQFSYVKNQDHRLIKKQSLVRAQTPGVNKRKAKKSVNSINYLSHSTISSKFVPLPTKEKASELTKISKNPLNSIKFSNEKEMLRDKFRIQYSTLNNFLRVEQERTNSI